MKIIYVAGPYSHGDVAVNVKTAMDAGAQLIEAGFAVFIPHLFHFLHLYHPQDYERWMAIDAAVLARCDAVLRLPGHSPGADREEQDAIQRDIPVFFTMESLVRYFEHV